MTHVWAPGDFILAADLNANFAQVAAGLPAAGGTMLGPLTLAADPAGPLQPVSLQYLQASLTGTNKLRNGRMLVCQRGLSFPAAQNAYTADGWIVNSNSGPVAVTIGNRNPLFAGSNYLACAAILPVGGYIQLTQRIESIDAVALVGQTVTVSFYVNATASAGTLSASVSLLFPTSPDNFGSISTIAAVAAPVSANVARVSATFATLPGVVANGFQVSIGLFLAAAAGSVVLDVGGVQMEVGTLATMLEYRPIALDLLACQRHYQTGLLYGAGYQVAGQPYSVVTPGTGTMRASPVVAAVGPANSNFTQASLGQFGTNFGTVGVFGTATATGTVGVNIPYTASAEL